MVMVDEGRQGAKRQSWRKASPRELLQRMIVEKRGHSETDLLRSFTSEVLDDQEMMEVIIEYWFANNYRSLVLPVRTHTGKILANRELAIKQAVSKVKNAIVHEAKIMLSELIMANGKPLQDCTGAECARFGGWLSKVAARIKPRQKVGSILTEDALRKLFAENT